MIVSQDNNNERFESEDRARETGEFEPSVSPEELPFASDPEMGPTESEVVSSDKPPEVVTSLQSQLEDANDRLLRLQAELENFRKRSRRELDEQQRYAQLPIIRDLLSVLDNLERAVSATNQSDGPTAEGLLQGVQLVTVELQTVLERHHCQRIEVAEGTVFDPNRHEAISQQPSAEHPPDTVMHVAQPGYHLYDRIVRPSQVVVATGVQDEVDSEISSDRS